MKTFFIHGKDKTDIKPVLEKITFKGRIGLVTNIQFLEQAKNIKKDKFIFGGQILGCNVNSALKIKDKIDCFLYVGSGDFHAFGLCALGKPVYVANPFTNEVKLIDKKEFQNYENKRKARISKFLMARKIGILVSLKPGQYHPGKYFGLKEKIKYAEYIKNKIKDKESYIFLCDNINLNELENFPDIEFWVNTACPRIESKDLINVEEVIKMYEK